MRRFKKWTAAFVMALTFSSVTAVQAMAANIPVLADSPAVDAAALAQLRLEDKGSDLSKGQLISEVWGAEEDGTPYVERTYVKHDMTMSIAPMAIYTKTKDYGATGSVEVSGNFSWNTGAQKAYVSSPSGKFNQGGGVSGTKNASATASGNGTTKATAKYSIQVNRNLGGWATYSVSLSYDYNGNDS